MPFLCLLFPLTSLVLELPAEQRLVLESPASAWIPLSFVLLQQVSDSESLENLEIWVMGATDLSKMGILEKIPFPRHVI